MFIPGPYAVEDRDTLRALIRERPFATVLVNGAHAPIAAHAPMIPDDEDLSVLVGHMNRANPFVAAARERPSALVVFGGDDCYVSASSYETFRTTGRVAPTWNYIRVEVQGELEVDDSPAANRAALDALASAFESARETPWTVDASSSDYIEPLLTYIVTLRLRVRSAIGVWKLSQDKPPADVVGAIADLERRGDHRARAVAHAMRAANAERI
jgi:transcriptional regulator